LAPKLAFRQERVVLKCLSKLGSLQGSATYPDLKKKKNKIDKLIGLMSTIVI